MTREEAIFCEKSYIGETNCTDCNYYGTETCLSRESHRMAVKALEQEPQTFKWCTDCKEYDQEKHCCHRWSKVIRDTVEEMKQEYIECEVLDELRAEITTLQNRCYALTKGTMCAFCKYECKYNAGSEET